MEDASCYKDGKSINYLSLLFAYEHLEIALISVLFKAKTALHF